MSMPTKYDAEFYRFQIAPTVEFAMQLFDGLKRPRRRRNVC
jgi:hypothetical protein